MAAEKQGWRRSRFLAVASMIFSGMLMMGSHSWGQVSLGEAQNFTVISSQGVTNSGSTIIVGDVALSPLTSITGFPPGTVTGIIHNNDGMAMQAHIDATSAYNSLAGESFSPGNNKSGVDLGGLTLSAGVYHFNSSASLTGALTLNTGGNPNAVFVFQIGSTLTTAAGSSVVVIGAGNKNDPNVYWQVGSSATLKSNTVFDGNILALQSISLGTGTIVVNGRLIALNGAVTLLSNNISPPGVTAVVLPGGPVVIGPDGTVISGPDGTGSGGLGELSPQKYEIYGDVAISDATALSGQVSDRLDNLRDGSESVDISGMYNEANGGPASASQPNMVPPAGYGKDGEGKDEVYKQSTPPATESSSGTERRWGFFAAGDGLFFRGHNRDASIYEGRADTAGTVAGVDAKIGEHAVLGALFSYDNSDVDLGSDGSHAKIQSYTEGIYAGWQNDGFYFDGLAAFTRNNYDSDRNIIFPGASSTALATTHGSQYTANLDGGYDWHVTNRLSLGPVGGLQYVHLDVDGFTEYSGGPSDLALGNETLNSLQSRLGARVNYHIATVGHVSYAMQVEAEWQHEFLNDSRSIDANFYNTGLAPFRVSTDAPLRDSAVLGLGFDVTFHDRFTLYTGCEFQFWRESYYEISLDAGGRLAF